MFRACAALSVLLIVAAGLALAAPPAAAAPAVTVDPAIDVIDGQTVTVQGTGFVPDRLAGAALCSSAVVDSEDPADCDLSEFGLGGVDDDGTVSLTLKAQRWLRIGDTVIDCAEGGRCVVGLGTAMAPAVLTLEEGAAAPIQFDGTVANDPPLLVDSEIVTWTPHSATVAVSCSRPDGVTINVHLTQPVPDTPEAFWPLRNGGKGLTCDGEHLLELPLVPRQRYGFRDWLYPYRRLRPGPATLTLSTESQTEGRWQVDRQEAQPVELVDPALGERRTFDSGSASVRALGVRITAQGEATAKIELSCDTEQIVQHVEIQALAPAPGAAYRQARGYERDFACGPTPSTYVLPLTELSYRSREDVLAAGPVELYTTVTDERRQRSYDLRPVTTRRAMRPASIRATFDPSSRLRIGPVTTEGVRVSFRCKRTARFSVFAWIGQPMGQVVFQENDRIVIRCNAGRTAVFDVPWRDDDSMVRRGRPTAVNVRAINGKHTVWSGPWQQSQGGWRTSR